MLARKMTMRENEARSAEAAERRRTESRNSGRCQPPFLRGDSSGVTRFQSRNLMDTEGAVEWPRLVEHGTARRVDASQISHFEECVEVAPRTQHAPPSQLPPCVELMTNPSLADSRAVDGPRSEESGSIRARIVGELYERAYHRVYCFARKSVGDEEAEEVAHESFVRLLKVRNLERMTISVAYLLRIAENLLKRRFERAQRYRVILERSGMVVSAATENLDVTPGSLPEVMNPDGIECDVGRLDTVLCQLTDEEQTAVRLIVCEGLDYQAAACSLGVPVSTINNWKHRGLAKLRKLVQSPTSGRHMPVSISAAC